MVNVGIRLREERERLAMTQEDVTRVVGLSKQALINYEKGRRSPDAAFLAAIAAAGADVLYILTGERSRPVAAGELLPERDRILLDNFHAAPEGVQAGVRATLGTFAPDGDSVKKKRRGKAA